MISHGTIVSSTLQSYIELAYHTVRTYWLLPVPRLHNHGQWTVIFHVIVM